MQDHKLQKCKWSNKQKSRPRDRNLLQSGLNNLAIAGEGVGCSENPNRVQKPEKMRMFVELLGLNCKTQAHPGEVAVYFYPWVAEVMPQSPGTREGVRRCL